MTEPAPSTGKWPRQSLPASRPPIRLTLPTRPPRQTEPPRRETIQSPAMPTIVYQRHEMAPSSSPTVPPVKMPRRDSPDEPMLTDDKPPTTTTTSHPCQNQLLRPNRRPQHLASHGPVNTPFEMSSTSDSSTTTPTTLKIRPSECSNIRSASQRPYKLSGQSTARDTLAT